MGHDDNRRALRKLQNIAESMKTLQARALPSNCSLEKRIGRVYLTRCRARLTLKRRYRPTVHLTQLLFRRLAVEVGSGHHVPSTEFQTRTTGERRYVVNPDVS